MKNNQQQILSEIKSLMASIKAQVEELENKIAEYEQSVDVEEVVEVGGAVELVEEKVYEPVEVAPVEPLETELVEEGVEDVMDIELEPSDDLPFYDDLPVSDSETEVELEPEAELDPEVELEPEAEVEPEVEVVPETVSEPETVPGPELVVEPAATETPVPVIDAMTARQQWRKDMPGSPVRDIRSAISLNDRILFINYLFGEDPMAFQEMLTPLNAMPSFDEAASLAIASHPEWDLESDTVYRFMMALRRRHQ
jgi:hypothetical protein